MRSILIRINPRKNIRSVIANSPRSVETRQPTIPNHSDGAIRAITIVDGCYKKAIRVNKVDRIIPKYLNEKFSQQHYLSFDRMPARIKNPIKDAANRTRAFRTRDL